MFLEVLERVRYARLLHVGERCSELCWGAVRLGRLICVSGFGVCEGLYLTMMLTSCNCSCVFVVDFITQAMLQR